MSVDLVLADRIIAFLNELNDLDPDFMARLVAARVKCNNELAEHPTVQAASPGEWLPGGVHSPTYTAGVLGVLNGLCGANENGWGPIAARVEKDNGEVLGFERSTPFAS